MPRTELEIVEAVEQLPAFKAAFQKYADNKFLEAVYQEAQKRAGEISEPLDLRKRGRGKESLQDLLRNQLRTQ